MKKESGSVSNLSFNSRIKTKSKPNTDNKVHLFVTLFAISSYKLDRFVMYHTATALLLLFSLGIP